MSLVVCFAQTNNRVYQDDSLYELIIKKSPIKYIHNFGCSFVIKVEESDLFPERKNYKEGYTFCYYDEEELFNEKVDHYVKVRISETKTKNLLFKIEWISISNQIGIEMVEK